MDFSSLSGNSMSTLWNSTWMNSLPLVQKVQLASGLSFNNIFNNFLEAVDHSSTTSNSTTNSDTNTDTSLSGLESLFQQSMLTINPLGSGQSNPFGLANGDVTASDPLAPLLSIVNTSDATSVQQGQMVEIQDPITGKMIQGSFVRSISA